MKYTFSHIIISFVFIFSVSVVGCKNSSETTNETVGDTALTSSKEVSQTNLFIKDKTQYSPDFIDDLLEANYEQPIKLIDNFLIIEGDTLGIPNYIKLNQTEVFSATNNDSTYNLSLTRANETNLKFKFVLSTNSSKKLLYSDSGEVVLNALFFLGSEEDEDDETGDAYECSEYSKHNDNDNCWLSIRLGSDGDKHKAKINYGCIDVTLPTLSSDDCPTLRIQ